MAFGSRTSPDASDLRSQTLIKLLEEDDDLRRKLLRKADINTIGTTRKKLVALTENCYPIDGVEYESYNESEDEEEEDDE